MNVVFKKSKLFEETSAKYLNDPKIQAAFAEFIKAKSVDPLKPFGSKDFPFKQGVLKGYPHVALAFDIRLIYTISGRNPTVIKLYWIGTHDESGTGQPGNLKRQAQLAKRLGQQVFD